MRRAPAAQAKVKAQRKKPSYPAKLIERRRRVVSRTGGRFGLDALNARKPKKKGDGQGKGRREDEGGGEGKKVREKNLRCKGSRYSVLQH